MGNMERKVGAEPNTDLPSEEDQVLVSYCLYMAKLSDPLSVDHIKAFVWAILKKVAAKGQKVKFGPNLDFFKDCFRTSSQNFSIFCMKLDNNKAFQMMYMLSSGKLLPRPFRGQKVKFWAQNGLF